MAGSYSIAPNPESWIPPPPSHSSLAHSSPGQSPSSSPFQHVPTQEHLQHPQQQNPLQQFSAQPPQSASQHQNASSSSLGSVSSMSLQSNTSTPVAPHSAQRPLSASSLTPPVVGPNSQRTSHRKMTAGSSPLAVSSPLASSTTRPSRIKPKPEMPTTLPPESVCECFICHSVSPYSQQPPPEIPPNQRQELSRLAPTCPSIHLFCLASRLPMSLPLDPTQKSPLTRSILDYFYSTWISADDDLRGPRVQCLNFIPIHPITASCFDRYVEGQSWNKRICRPLWHAADLRCKLGLEGMYRNCMQEKCASCFIFNDGYEDAIAKNKYVYLSPQSSRAHEHLAGTHPLNSGSNADMTQDSDNKVQCMILTFAALGRSYDIPPSNDKIKRPPKGWDVVHRPFDIRKENHRTGATEISTGEEYAVFAADAIVPLAMVLYKVL